MTAASNLSAAVSLFNHKQAFESALKSIGVGVTIHVSIPAKIGRGAQASLTISEETLTPLQEVMKREIAKADEGLLSLGIDISK